MDLSASFQKFYHTSPQAQHFAPGRVNLIGEHIDYNGGHVLPAPLSVDSGESTFDIIIAFSLCLSEGPVVENEIYYHFILSGHANGSTHFKQECKRYDYWVPKSVFLNCNK